MTKIGIIPNEYKQIKRLQNKVDAVILGMKDLSVNYEKEYSIEEIKHISENFKGDIFVSINKNILNDEIEEVKRVLNKLEKVRIKGVLFYDLSLLYFKQKHDFSYDFVWAQEHFTTNYATTLYYEKEGVDGTFLSSDITLEEILTIKENANGYVMTTVFGHLPMFASRRNLIDNYKKTFHLSSDDKKYYITKKDERYPIIDCKQGTYVYSARILNAALHYPALCKNKMDYVFLNSFEIEDDIFEEIVSLFSQLTDENKNQIKEKIDILCRKNTDTGFFDKETIYKVRRTL